MTNKNEWLDIPDQAPYVAPSDASVISKYNEVIDSDYYKFRTELIPEPYIGDPDAPVYLLSLNPGFSACDIDWHRQDSFREALMGNLVHRQSEFPFYYLNPEFAEAPGSDWWLRKLKSLIAETSIHRVSNGIFCAEYLGYHSVKYKKISKKVSNELLPTQVYTASLVEKAMAQGKIIVLMRSRILWYQLVPKLSSYKKLFIMNSPQNPALTRRNLNEFQFIVEQIS